MQPAPAKEHSASALHPPRIREAPIPGGQKVTPITSIPPGQKTARVPISTATVMGGEGHRSRHSRGLTVKLLTVLPVTEEGLRTALLTTVLASESGALRKGPAPRI